MNTMQASTSTEFITVRLVRSPTGCLPKHRATLVAMGLRRLNQSTTLPRNAATLGMINLVNYLIKIEGE